MQLPRTLCAALFVKTSTRNANSTLVLRKWSYKQMFGPTCIPDFPIDRNTFHRTQNCLSTCTIIGKPCMRDVSGKWSIPTTFYIYCI